jgi:hypothetical protein
MRIGKLSLAIGIIGVLGFAVDARAQWMQLQRCRGALPCSIPFGVRYAPDPLLGAQYGFVSPDAFSGRISLDPKLTVEIDQPRLSLSPGDFAEEAARRFVLANPPPPKSTPALKNEPMPPRRPD